MRALRNMAAIVAFAVVAFLVYDGMGGYRSFLRETPFETFELESTGGTHPTWARVLCGVIAGGVAGVFVWIPLMIWSDAVERKRRERTGSMPSKAGTKTEEDDA